MNGEPSPTPLSRLRALLHEIAAATGSDPKRPGEIGIIADAGIVDCTGLTQFAM